VSEMDSDSEGDQLTNLAQAETPGFHLPRTELGTLIGREFDTRLSEHCVAIKLLFAKHGLPRSPSAGHVEITLIAHEAEHRQMFE
jgi:hypothetical protein